MTPIFFIPVLPKILLIQLTSYIKHTLSVCVSVSVLCSLCTTMFSMDLNQIRHVVSLHSRDGHGMWREVGVPPNLEDAIWGRGTAGAKK